jgi:hypothetical protein
MSVSYLPFKGTYTGQKGDDNVICEAGPLVRRLRKRLRSTQHEEVDAVAHEQLQAKQEQLLYWQHNVEGTNSAPNILQGASGD